MPKQMQLDLRGDVFLKELEVFEMLYAPNGIGHSMGRVIEREGFYPVSPSHPIQQQAHD